VISATTKGAAQAPTNAKCTIGDATSREHPCVCRQAFRASKAKTGKSEWLRHTREDIAETLPAVAESADSEN